MTNEIVQLIQSLGVPIGLIVYYLTIERPRQEKKEKEANVRHDLLVNKVIESQIQCAEKMNKALTEHTEAIHELKLLIDNKIR